MPWQKTDRTFHRSFQFSRDDREIVSKIILKLFDESIYNSRYHITKGASNLYIEVYTQYDSDLIKQVIKENPNTVIESEENKVVHYVFSK